MSQLTGKVALVTGSGRGIGRAIAIAFATEGADLILAARTTEQLDAVAEEIRALGRKVLPVPTDVTNRQSVDALAEKVRGEFDRLDILVNNAGGGIERNSILDSNPDPWIETIAVNCISAYLVSHALLPLMIESGGGRVINVGSGMGHRPRAGNSAYNVGKAGMWMFTQCLAEEVWEHSITVNELIPGPVATHLTGDRMRVGGPPPFAPSEVVKAPEDVVPLALFLATQPDGGPTAQTFSLTRRPI
ncbi:MAG: SDR family NAD(P)-dependent oxidoreductase [Gemmatimonadetes bacterium]|nr:SDR family NAD(P)-dependent oxidoreductase [Gemmatimonadota bacterium]